MVQIASMFSVIKILLPSKLIEKKHLLIAKTAVTRVNSRQFYGSVVSKPKNALR